MSTTRNGTGPEFFRNHLLPESVPVEGTPVSKHHLLAFRTEAESVVSETDPEKMVPGALQKFGQRVTMTHGLPPVSSLPRASIPAPMRTGRVILFIAEYPEGAPARTLILEGRLESFMEDYGTAPPTLGPPARVPHSIGDQVPAGASWKGGYVSGQTYHRGDAVEVGGIVWTCTVPQTRRDPRHGEPDWITSSAAHKEFPPLPTDPDLGRPYTTVTLTLRRCTTQRIPGVISADGARAAIGEEIAAEDELASERLRREIKQQMQDALHEAARDGVL